MRTHGRTPNKFRCRLQTTTTEQCRFVSRLFVCLCSLTGGPVFEQTYSTSTPRFKAIPRAFMTRSSSAGSAPLSTACTCSVDRPSATAALSASPSKERSHRFLIISLASSWSVPLSSTCWSSMAEVRPFFCSVPDHFSIHEKKVASEMPKRRGIRSLRKPIYNNGAQRTHSQTKQDGVRFAHSRPRTSFNSLKVWYSLEPSFWDGALLRHGGTS